ncbi:transcriptional regulator [candidate division KSB1 bacterium]|nr:transcriptional regulator [candidate division KSB1 bacterium]
MIKTITTDTEYRQALKRADKLIDVDPEPGTPQADELEQLVDLIVRWEDEHYPLESPDPEEAVKFRNEQQGAGE